MIRRSINEESISLSESWEVIFVYDYFLFFLAAFIVISVVPVVSVICISFVDSRVFGVSISSVFPGLPCLSGLSGFFVFPGFSVLSVFPGLSVLPLFSGFIFPSRRFKRWLAMETQQRVSFFVAVSSWLELIFVDLHFISFKELLIFLRLDQSQLLFFYPVSIDLLFLYWCFSLNLLQLNALALVILT